MQPAALHPFAAGRATVAAPPRDGLLVVRRGYLAMVIGATLLQCVFFPHASENLLAVAVAAFSSFIGIAYALDVRRFRFAPVSALILMFFTTTSTSAALIVKTVEWKPLVDALQVPLTTFPVLLGCQLTLIGADMLYVRSMALQKLRAFISRRILRPARVMDWPADQQFWLLGFLGCLTVLMTGTDYESGASFGMASAGDKVIRAFGFFKFAPFLVLFRNALSGVPDTTRRNLLPFGAYFTLLVVLSFATNSRSTFADAIPTIGVCMLISAAYGYSTIGKIPKAKLLLMAVGAGAVAMLLSRIALAMVVVRDFRSDVDVLMLVKMTIEALGNDEWLDIARTKMDAAVNIGNYSETYVNSRFMARFILTKFHDNIFYYFSIFGPDHILAYREFMFDRFWATLPDPLLQKLGISINKADLVVSNGDYIVYMMDGWGLGGFKTGSMIAEVYGVFGWLYPLVMFGSALLLFVVHDAFVDQTVNGPDRRVFSPLILLLMWSLVGTTASFGFGAETVTQIPSNIMRGLPQSIVFYVIGVAGARFAGRFLP